MGWWTDMKRTGGRFLDEVTGKRASRDAKDAAAQQAAAGRQAGNYSQSMLRNARNEIGQYSDRSLRDYMEFSDAQRAGKFKTDPGSFEFDEYQGPDDFKYDSFNFSADPGYQFRLEQGLSAAKNQASARGMTGGGLLTELMNYGQGMASQEVGNAFGRYANQRDFARGGYESDRAFGRGNYDMDRAFGYGVFSDDFGRRQSENAANYGRMAHLGQYGPMAQNRLADMWTQHGQDYGNNLMGIGNVQAAGTMGASNAMSKGWGNIGEMGKFGFSLLGAG
jgi:hypothetical protein